MPVSHTRHIRPLLRNRGLWGRAPATLSHLTVRPSLESLGECAGPASPSRALSRGCVPGEAGPRGHSHGRAPLMPCSWDTPLVPDSSWPGRGVPASPETHQRERVHPSKWDKAFPCCGRIWTFKRPCPWDLQRQPGFSVSVLRPHCLWENPRLPGHMSPQPSVGSLAI